MNVLNLRKSIQTFLLTKASRVYYKKVPPNAQYPYVVFTLDISYENQIGREDFNLEIDVWDDDADLTNIETLVGNIDGDGALSNPTGMHRKAFFEADKLVYKAYRERRLDIVDEDVRIEHRQLQYTLKVYLLA